MNKQLREQNYNKRELMKNIEIKELVDNSQKLAKVNDLWYFVKSKQHRWIVGSGH